MNIKKVLGIGFACVGMAFAQNSAQNSVQDTLRGPGFVPRPKTQFDVLHGNAYNRQRNVAAANNIDLLLRYPNLFANEKFFYIEPSGEMGVVSFGHLFSAVDISGDVGRFTVGYSMLGFGAYLRAGLGHVKYENDDVKRWNTSAGDDIGLAIAKTIKGYNIGLSADWLTYANETELNPKNGPKSEERYRDLGVNLSVTNAPKARKLFWTVGLNFCNHLNEFEVDGKIVPDTSDSYIQFVPLLRLGYVGLQNEHARVIAGLGAMFPLTYHDDYTFRNANGDAQTRSLDEYTFLLEPQILGEVYINKNVMVFGEASYQWVAASYQEGSDKYGENYDVLVTQMDKVDASMGLRLQYQDFVACEFALGDTFFRDTKAVFNGEGVFISFGAFLYF